MQIVDPYIQVEKVDGKKIMKNIERDKFAKVIHNELSLLDTEFKCNPMFIYEVKFDTI